MEKQIFKSKNILGRTPKPQMHVPLYSPFGEYNQKNKALTTFSTTKISSTKTPILVQDNSSLLRSLITSKACI